jgi:hypothetical protein
MRVVKTLMRRRGAGTNAGKSQAGVVELNGDTLKICMAALGKSRPADFKIQRQSLIHDVAAGQRVAPPHRIDREA